MRKLLTFVLGTTLLVACVDESTRQPRADDSPAAAPGPNVEVADPVEASPVEVQVFEETRDARDRLMVRMLIRADAQRPELRATLDSITRDRREADPTLAAVRTVGYVGVVPSPDAVEANLRPIVWGEWVPADGWEAAAPGRDIPHRFYFYYRTRPEW